jgi:excisionase family DNA binding protein
METNDLLNAILSEMKSMRNSNRRWMSIEDLSDYLGLKINTIYQYVSQKKIPCKRIPGSSRLIFSRNEIDLWIKNGKTPDQDSTNATTESTRIWKEIKREHS